MRGWYLIMACLLVLAGCTPNNVDQDNSLEKYFKENNVKGCFALYNNKTGRFTIYNLERYRDSAYSPASTFKIVNSLVGLQTGVITNDSMVIKWDGVTRWNPEWNRDLTMYEAFRVSAVPYYQEVARRIGRDTMQQWLDTLAYGNKKIGSRIDSFWLDGTLKLTSDEQLGLMKRLYFNQLPFHRINQETVKRAMLFEDKPEYKLSYKTGMSDFDGNRRLGWVVGWIEENRHPYMFVLNLETADAKADLSAIRMKVLRGILEQQGFFKGNK